VTPSVKGALGHPIHIKCTTFLSSSKTTQHTTRGCVTWWPCHLHKKKAYLNAKEELSKLKYFTKQKYNLSKKNPLKETQKHMI
jgi:hypothetical protein